MTSKLNGSTPSKGRMCIGKHGPPCAAIHPPWIGSLNLIRITALEHWENESDYRRAGKLEVTHERCPHVCPILSIPHVHSFLTGYTAESWKQDNPSALIIEDDADWDVALKSQLETFANKTRALGNAGRNESLWTTSETPTHSPYGDDWDLLWLGSCATPPAPPETATFPGEGEQDHYVFSAGGGMSCLYGYAITHESAKTLMGWLLDVDEPTDFAISQYCEHFRCVAVWPQLIGEHKPMGPRTKDSSIKEGDDGSFREKGETSRIVHSAILDMLEKVGHKGLWEG
ncbi:MAG: hypothetical protein Q9182_006736 [Xanthomendoza sp. 2 TL-2023]